MALTSSRGKRAPVRRPAMEFRSRRADRVRDPSSLAVSATPGVVSLRGGLSAGRRGWSLSATIERFRRTLHVWVIARQVDATDGFDVEDHDYAAEISGLASGRYRLRVSHVYVPWGEERAVGGLEVYDRHVDVP